MADDRTHTGRKLTCLEHCALHRRTITLTCPGCKRVRRYDAAALWWLFEQRRWDDRLPGAYRRLYCAACLVTVGRKLRPKAEITRDPPDAEQLPYPDKPTWNRVVSRYRS